jgi:cytoskeletal protein RodZ
MLTLQRNVANGRNKKKRRVSLSYILALIVAAYLLFVYLVMARFYNSGGKEEKHPNNGSASSQLQPETSSAKKQATLDDFCGYTRKIRPLTVTRGLSGSSRTNI